MTPDTEQLIREYYKSYYWDQLGLKDFQQRIRNRLNEEETFALPVINKLEQLLNYDFAGKKVLIVGAGTGAEFIALHKKNADVYALEPDEDAIAILHAKRREHKITPDRVIAGVAENLPFPDESFDFVYCYTVLEHVQNIKQALTEILRVWVPSPDFLCWRSHFSQVRPKKLQQALMLLPPKCVGRSHDYTR